MSNINVDTIKNRSGAGAPSFPNGLTVTGVATATTFSGNLTGNATGLTGSPSISVSGVNNTGVSTLTDTRLASIADKTTLVSGNTVSLVYNTGGGNVAICTNPTGPITLNVTGVPTTPDFNDRSLNFAVIVRQGTTGYGCSSLVLNGVVFNSTAAVGVSTRISYPSGTVSTASTSGYDIFNFIGINTTGSASTMTNYNFISIKNGDFRFY
jgi:hypothetical protein